MSIAGSGRVIADRTSSPQRQSESERSARKQACKFRKAGIGKSDGNKSALRAQGRVKSSRQSQPHIECAAKGPPACGVSRGTAVQCLLPSRPSEILAHASEQSLCEGSHYLHLVCLCDAHPEYPSRRADTAAAKQLRSKASYRLVEHHAWRPDARRGGNIGKASIR